MRRAILFGCSTPLFQGCATSIETFYNRPVVEDSIGGVAATVSLSADRRTVVIVTEGANAGKFCAEGPPDIAKEISTELSASLEAENKANCFTVTRFVKRYLHIAAENYGSFCYFLLQIEVLTSHFKRGISS